ALGMHQGHQGLRGLGPLWEGQVFWILIDHRHKSQRACREFDSGHNKARLGGEVLFEIGDLKLSSRFLWRGSLLPFGCAAVVIR
ncbi:hypothetical protein AB4142_28745, partial [Variovorax sp. 2RAF20]